MCRCGALDCSSCGDPIRYAIDEEADRAFGDLVDLLASGVPAVRAIPKILSRPYRDREYIADYLTDYIDDAIWHARRINEYQ